MSATEKEAALILKDIVYGYKIGEPNYIPNGINKLSEGLYHLSFKRIGKKPVDLRQAQNPMAIIQNTKLLHYVSVYKSINESIENFATNPIVLNKENSIHEYEQSILEILKITSSELKKI